MTNNLVKEMRVELGMIIQMCAASDTCVKDVNLELVRQYVNVVENLRKWMKTQKETLLEWNTKPRIST